VETRLTVELVPSTCWYTNVRSNVSKAVWDRLRGEVAADAGNRCEVCGGRGRRWPVECHEMWDYDDDRKIQRLERLVALCPACHEVKQASLVSKPGGSQPWCPASCAVCPEPAYERAVCKLRYRAGTAWPAPAGSLPGASSIPPRRFVP